jgi:predicted ATPase/transcriptional regulator with XRE-family HTH domain/Tfp pilus assembly protein PilF
MPTNPHAAAASFSALLKRYRVASGLTQEGLAERAGISARAVSDLERDGSRTPRQDTLMLLAEALGLSAEQRVDLIAAAHPDVAPPPPLPAPKVEEPAYAHALPVPLTPLIGREREVETVVALLAQPAVRLVTLTGPGGVGKTRLALATAERLAAAGDLLCWIDLATLRDAGLVAPALAQVFGLQPLGNQLAEALLVQHLRDRRLLLLLDNFEQVLTAAGVLSTLLERCPGVRILVTSRAALHLRGEHEVVVPPLAVPDANRPLPPAALADVPAVALFLARAQATAPDVRLTAATGPAIAEICRRLDGLPLALELAAARSKLLPPQALLARLASRLGLLVGGARDMPARHQTMRATLAWSYELLGLDERRLFHWLSVFSGGWSLEAAEAVCAQAGMDDVLGALEALLDQSLVQRRTARAGEPRFGMLEMVREYALEQLAASGERAEARRAHAEYYLELVESAESGLVGPEQAMWLALLEWEHDNLRAVLAWSLEEPARPAPATLLQPRREPLEIGMRVAGAIWRFWHVHGYVTEGRVWLDRLLGRSSTAMERDQALTLRARILAAAAALATEQGDHARASAYAGESLDLYRSLGDQRRVAVVLNILGATAMRLGEYSRSVALYEESLAHFRALDIPQSIATVLNNLGTVARYQGEYTHAAALYEESLAIKRTLKDARGIAITLNNLGDVALDQGHLDRAAQLFEQCLALFRQQEEQWSIALALTNLGDVARARGEHLRALDLYRQSLALYRDLRNYLDVGECLDGIAAVVCALGDPHRAARLLAAAAALRAALNMPVPPVERADQDRILAAARAALDDAAFAASRAAGQAMSPEDAIADALAWDLHAAPLG